MRTRGQFLAAGVWAKWRGWAKWSGSARLPLLLSALVAFGLAGCGPHTDSASYSATALEPSVPKASQEQARQLVMQFAQDVQGKDYAKACLMMSPALRFQLPPAKLAQEMRGMYQPLAGARQWQFDLIQYLAHGQKLVVHAHFTGPENGVYRTNLAFIKTGNAWLIDMILPPSKASQPTASRVQPLSTPGH